MVIFCNESFPVCMETFPDKFVKYVVQYYVSGWGFTLFIRNTVIKALMNKMMLCDPVVISVLTFPPVFFVVCRLKS